MSGRRRLGDQLYCLVFETGGALSEAMCEGLVVAAKGLYDDKVREVSFDWDDCMGMVETAWQVVSIGSLTGFKFDATLDHISRGSFKLSFLVREPVLSGAVTGGVWGSSPLKDIYSRLEEEARGVSAKKLPTRH